MAKAVQQVTSITPEKLEETNARLAEVSALIYPDNLVLKVVLVDTLTEQKVNPRSMPQKMFDQMIENVKNTGQLESVPLCAQVGEEIHIISGHHRTRAARAAGIQYILVLLFLDLADSRIKAKQLAHNNISGSDDPELLRRVFDMITDVQAQFEAFVDPRVFEAIPQAVSFKPVDVQMQNAAKTVVIVFLDTQFKNFDAAVQAVMPKVKSDKIYLAHKDAFEGWRDTLNRVREECDIVSVPAALSFMAELVNKQLDLDAKKKAKQVEP
jgi:hypothetical protein